MQPILAAFIGYSGQRLYDCQKNWLFTYIGANQDALAVARDMGIDQSMNFMSSVEGTKAMFMKEKLSRKLFYSKLAQGISFKEAMAGEDYFVDDNEKKYDRAVIEEEKKVFMTNCSTVFDIMGFGVEVREEGFCAWASLDEEDGEYVVPNVEDPLSMYCVFLGVIVEVVKRMEV